MFRRLSRPVLSLAVPLAALYGIEPAMAEHMIEVLVAPFRSALDLATRAH